MAKTAPDMIVQMQIVNSELEAALKMLADAIRQITPATMTPAQEALAASMQAAQEALATQPQTVQETPATQEAPVVQPQAQPQMAQEAPAAQPQPQPQTAQPQAAPEVPTPTPTITLDAICNAGAKLVEQGRMNQVIQLIGKYGVQAVNQIKPEQFEEFANDLRILGAQI